MKKICKCLIILLLLFSFAHVYALDYNVELMNVDDYGDISDLEEDDLGEEGVQIDEDLFGDGELTEDVTDNELTDDDFIGIDEISEDENVENSKTGDISIIIISLVATISFIIILVKKNSFLSNKI